MFFLFFSSSLSPNSFSGCKSGSVRQRVGRKKRGSPPEKHHQDYIHKGNPKEIPNQFAALGFVFFCLVIFYMLSMANHH